MLQRLRVADIPAGGRVEIRCTVPKRAPKSACPFTRKTFTPKKGVVNALSSFKKKRLRVGTVVEVRITAPQSIGRVVRFTVRRKRRQPGHRALPATRSDDARSAAPDPARRRVTL